MATMQQHVVVDFGMDPPGGASSSTTTGGVVSKGNSTQQHVQPTMTDSGSKQDLNFIDSGHDGAVAFSTTG